MHVATLLIVDDESVNLMVLDKILSHTYNVRVANSGVRALELVNSPPYPDLILLDLEMPAMNGYAVLEALKANARTRDIPVIFITATVSTLEEEKGLNLGAVDYIIKPISPAILLARVQTHLLVKQAAEVTRHIKELKYEKSLLRSLLDLSPDYIFYKDLEGRYLGCNKAVEDLFGCKEQDVIGKTDFDFFDAGLARFVRAKDQLMLKLNQPQRNDEWVVFPDGHKVMLDTLKLPLQSGNDEIIGILGISRDITERVLIEESLEQRILARTKELSVANEHLQELDQLKSSFIAIMSHELKSPLNTIIGFSSMILDGVSGEVTEEQQDYLERVLHAGEHLNALVTDILDMSKIEAGKLDCQYSDVNVLELANELYKTLQLQFEQKQLHYQQHIATKNSIRTDRKRLLQCLINLMTNAIKYSCEGVISLSIAEEGKHFIFAVSDQGIGIDVSKQSWIFKEFTRIDSSLSKREQGSGLGLYLTKKIVEDMLAGDIVVTSQINKGSTFSIRLPH